MRIAIAEDHPMMRQALKTLLPHHGFDVILEAKDGDEFLGKLEPMNLPEVAVLDFRMPKRDGLSTARQLRTDHPEMGIVLFSAYVDAALAESLLKLGAGVGYVVKDSLIEDLESAIRTTASGGIFIDSAVARQMTAREDAKDRFNSLSTREKQILAELASGASNVAIAEKFGLSHKTVMNHLSSIFTKLDITNNPNLSPRTMAAIEWMSARDRS
jgi:DNA-binding NarL/FixJ family response regulator